ncbi:MAG: hypothetical protein JSS60_04005 [Verrucomicrobia bacterium]|nr:hypothetical protein [Verrucomicrobiota bacterium]
MHEGKDLQGYSWVQDTHFENYYYLKDFEHLVVMKVVNFSEALPIEHWEAVVFEDERCQKVIGRQEFPTMREAQANLEQFMEVLIKNRKAVE